MLCRIESGSRALSVSEEQTVSSYYTNLREDSDDRVVKRLKQSNRTRTLKKMGDMHDLTNETSTAATAVREEDIGTGPIRKKRNLNSNTDIDMMAKNKHGSTLVDERNCNADLADNNARAYPLSLYAESEGSDGDVMKSRVQGRQSMKSQTPSFLTERGMKKIVYEEMRSDWLSRAAPPVLSLVRQSNGRASREATAAMFKGLWGASQWRKGLEGEVDGEGEGVSALHDWLTVTFAPDWVGMQGTEVHPTVITGHSKSHNINSGATATSDSHAPTAEAQGGNVISRCPNVSAVEIEFKGEEEDTRLFLRPFEGKRSNRHGLGTVTSSADVGVDLYLNIGGPIWAIAFAPHTPVSSHPSPSLSPSKSHDSLSSSGSLQFLAVGTSRVGWEKSTESGLCSVGNDAQYAVGGRFSTPNLLQIWCLSIGGGLGEINGSGKMMMNRAASGNPCRRSDKMDTAALCYSVALTRGPVWKVAWSSWSPYIDLQSDRRDGDASLFLGVLAVVCGDGSCLILVLPRSISPTHSTSHEAADPPSGPTVVQEHSVCRWVLTVPAHAPALEGHNRGGDIRCVGGGEDMGSGEERVNILSAAWSPHHPLQLCCGLADGAIALFNLESHLTELHSSSSNTHSYHYPQAQSVGDETSNQRSEADRIPVDGTYSAGTQSGHRSDSPFRGPSVSHPLTATATPTHCLRDSTAHRIRHKGSSGAAVRSASFCPYHPNLLLSSGYSSEVKVWSTKNPSSPLLVRTFPVENGWLYDSRWDPQGRGYFVGCSDNSAVRNSSASIPILFFPIAVTSCNCILLFSSFTYFLSTFSSDVPSIRCVGMTCLVPYPTREIQTERQTQIAHQAIATVTAGMGLWIEAGSGLPVQGYMVMRVGSRVCGVWSPSSATGRQH
jgi:hypothetical protein